MPETTVKKSSWTDEDDVERTQYSITIQKTLTEALDLEQGDKALLKSLEGDKF